MTEKETSSNSDSNLNEVNGVQHLSQLTYYCAHASYQPSLLLRSTVIRRSGDDLDESSFDWLYFI